MKLICTDIDNCGFFSKVQDLEVQDHNNMCPHCFCLAIEVSDNHNPLLYQLDDEDADEKILTILATYYNYINHMQTDTLDESEGEED